MTCYLSWSQRRESCREYQQVLIQVLEHCATICADDVAEQRRVVESRECPRRKVDHSNNRMYSTIPVSWHHTPKTGVQLYLYGGTRSTHSTQYSTGVNCNRSTKVISFPCTVLYIVFQFLCVKHSFFHVKIRLKLRYA